MKLKSCLLLSVFVLTAIMALTPDFAGPAGLASAQQPAPKDQKKPEQKPAQKPPAQEAKEKEDEGQTIKMGTQLVNVLFSVTDKQNRYLNELSQNDISVLEDGKAQKVFIFKRETDLPLTLCLLIDVSGSTQYVLPRLKEAGSQFVESIIRVGKDTAAVIQFEGEATLLQGLTSNPARLRKALDEVSFTAPPPIGVFGGATPPINGGARQGGTSIYDSIIATSADLLAKEPGRKTIILLSDGADTTSRKKIGDAIDEALRAEVVIYSIGIGDPSFGGIDEGTLKKLTDATGGRTFIPKSGRDLDAAFAQLEKDLRQQYLLAYEPTNEANDGTFRKIEVKVPNQKDIKVRHRRGYYAPKG
jgi:Ca-activated chloride channel homolog